MRQFLNRLLALPLLIAAAPAAAQAPGSDFIDDRSSAERVIVSLYNAVNRQEYLRAWSYNDPQTAPKLEEFKAGYANTVEVVVRTGESESEGAAGSIHISVPVAIKATEKGGKERVYVGCYRLTQVQPANQEVPPYRPIQIDTGTLEPTDAAFDSAMGTCSAKIEKPAN